MLCPVTRLVTFPDCTTPPSSATSSDSCHNTNTDTLSYSPTCQSPASSDFIYSCTSAYCPVSTTPRYQQGGDWFPLPERRFHPWGIKLLVHHKQLVGNFSNDCFQIRWAGTGHQINDSVILKVKPKNYYSHTRFWITTQPQAWMMPVHCGDVVMFQGLDSPDVKYLVAWTVNDDHDPHHCYVQVNALNKNQQCLHSDDVDWPALGFLIPKHMCQVPEIHQHKIPEALIIDYNNLAPSSPSLSDSSSPLRKCPRLNWKKSIPNLQDIPNIINLGRCGKGNATDNLEMDFM